MRPACPRLGTVGTPGTIRDASTPVAARLGVERLLVQIQSPRLVQGHRQLATAGDGSAERLHIGAHFRGYRRRSVCVTCCGIRLCVPQTGSKAVAGGLVASRGSVARWRSRNVDSARGNARDTATASSVCSYVVCGVSLEGMRADARHCGSPDRAETGLPSAILSGRAVGPYPAVAQRGRGLSWAHKSWANRLRSSLGSLGDKPTRFKAKFSSKPGR
jgi:hypothetical protein